MFSYLCILSGNFYIQKPKLFWTFKKSQIHTFVHLEYTFLAKNKLTSSNQIREKSYPIFSPAWLKIRGAKIYKIKKYPVSLMRSHRPFIFSCILSFLYLISLLFLSLLLFSSCNALHLVEKDNFKSLLRRSTKPFKSISSD